MFEWLQHLGASSDGAETETDHVGTVSGGSFEADREVHRVVDEEAGVVVYAMTGGQSAGVSTVPLEDTDLDGGGWDRR
jgi:hypothetical protein